MPKNESHIKMCFIVYLAFPGLPLVCCSSDLLIKQLVCGVV